MSVSALSQCGISQVIIGSVNYSTQKVKSKEKQTDKLIKCIANSFRGKGNWVGGEGNLSSRANTVGGWTTVGMEEGENDWILLV